MTDDALAELVALKARLAELEAMAAGAGKEPTTMYGNESGAGSIAAQNAALQDRHRAEAWRYDPHMEAALARLERDPDDPRLGGQIRMSAALYRDGKAAAKRAGIDTTGGKR